MRFITILLLAMLSFSLPSFASAEKVMPPSVKKAESYLQKLGTAQARFLQTSHNGVQMVGTFYLNRPGKLRFEYDDPVEDFIVADSFFIYFYDAELGEQSNAPIGHTLANFLLQPDISLSGDITVNKVARHESLLLIELIQSDDPGAGSLTLGFEEEPFKLKKWRITDSQNMITEIELFQMETGIRLDDSLFIYAKPHKDFEYND